MRIIRFIVIFLLLLLAVICGAWYYVTNMVADEINAKYAGKQFPVQGIDQKDYYITFDKAEPAGFPFRISWNIKGWREESRGAKISYLAPVNIGYDLLLQQVFVRYDGEIMSAYKPEKNGFGSRLNIRDYKISADLLLTPGLFNTIKNMKDPVEIINHVGDINIATKKVEIFDLVDNEKFYDKEYEYFQVTFKPKKRYISVEDLMQNIPQHYTFDYVVKMNNIDAKPRRLPVSLFYGFSALPSGMNIEASAVVKTEGNNIDEINKGLDIKAKMFLDSTYVKMPNYKLDYKAGPYDDGSEFALATKSKLHFKDGMFDELFKRYEFVAPKVASTPAGRLVDREIRYVIKNKDKFRFKELENQDYEFNLTTKSSRVNKNIYMKVDDFSIFSKNSGFKIEHEMEMPERNQEKWFAKGLLYIKNYPSIVEFSSGYIYRFGKFRFLSEEARDLYVDVNTKFLKSISDHPDSDSNDLSFEYMINAQNLNKAKFGSARIDQIAQLYSLMLYEKLIEKVGPGGDVLGRMRKIIPDIDGNEPMLKKILPEITGGKDLEEKAKKEIEKIIPKEDRESLKKLLPKDKLDAKKLFKGF